MKKILLYVLLGISLLLVYPVNAKENRLYFTESNNRLYYDSDLIDENLFMKHLNMVPGSSFTDELVLQNGTSTDYTLYFKVQVEEQSEEAEELLDNIFMRIYLDDVLIYDGVVKGEDFDESGVNLQDVISLGLIPSSSSSLMRVETNLSTEYSNIDNNELSSTKWIFYAQYEDSEPVEIIKVPNTKMNRFPIFSVLSIGAIIVGLFILIYAKRKEKEEK